MLTLLVGDADIWEAGSFGRGLGMIQARVGVQQALSLSLNALDLLKLRLKRRERLVGYFGCLMIAVDFGAEGVVKKDASKDN